MHSLVEVSSEQVALSEPVGVRRESDPQPMSEITRGPTGMKLGNILLEHQRRQLTTLEEDRKSGACIGITSLDVLVHDVVLNHVEESEARVADQR